MLVVSVSEKTELPLNEGVAEVGVEVVGVLNSEVTSDVEVVIAGESLRFFHVFANFKPSSSFTVVRVCVREIGIEGAKVFPVDVGRVSVKVLVSVTVVDSLRFRSGDVPFLRGTFFGVLDSVERASDEKHGSSLSVCTLRFEGSDRPEKFDNVGTTLED